jgi:uncharacterized protein YciI
MLPRSARLSLCALALCLMAGPARAHAQTPPATAAPGPPAAAPMRSAPLYLVIYRAGPAWKGEVAATEQLRDHGRHMLGLHQKKALRMAGPFSDTTGGAAVLEAESLAAAQALVDADPIVSAKVFVAEVHSWSHVNWDEIGRRLAPKPAAEP